VRLSSSGIARYLPQIAMEARKSVIIGHQTASSMTPPLPVETGLSLMGFADIMRIWIGML
jgi:hypothetical protein